MKTLKSSNWCAIAACLSLVLAFGCSDDESGTDIEVGGTTSTSGSGGSKAGGSSGGSGNRAGSSSDGGASDEGGAGGSEPTAGSGGNGSGGSAGMGGKTSGGNGGGGMGGTVGGGGMSGSGGATSGSGGGGAGGGGAAGGGAGGGSGASGAGGGGTGGSGTGGVGGGGAGAGGGGTGGAGAGGGGTGGGGNQTCGNGAVEGSEECDDSGPSPLCSDACFEVATQECYDCEQISDCFASSNNCAGPSASPFSAENVGVCYDVVQCIQDSGCLKGENGSLGACYCGSLTTAACGAAPFDLSKPGAPNGPCAEIMQLGNPGVTTNSAILGGLTNKSRPAGAAGQRLNCHKTAFLDPNFEDQSCKTKCKVE